MLVGWDLAPRKAGWCAGDGSTVPTADGFRLPGVTESIGEALEEMRPLVQAVHDRFRPTLVLFECPILPTSGGPSVMGSLAQRRVQINQSGFLEWLCLRDGIPCVEVGVYEVKQALTGSKKADKDQMIAAAEKLGIRLPVTLVGGREDAADAAGVWLVGVRHYAKQYAPAWDRRVYSPRGALL